MIPSELDDLVGRVNFPGWNFWTVNRTVHLRVIETPEDSRIPDAEFVGLADQFVVNPDWTEQQVLERLFCNLQYLVDHELREHFTLDGHCVFDPHNPSVTGAQKDWFVERQSALAGY
jgi:hypothetical protein